MKSPEIFFMSTTLPSAKSATIILPSVLVRYNFVLLKDFKSKSLFNKKKPVTKWEKDNTLDC